MLTKIIELLRSADERQLRAIYAYVKAFLSR